ncbi:hypothetical protein B0H63DRAFT_84654 [Podospora didyma]|uniref:Uncharacterized protein n=1 Tax=Podospora didyma TaxID=330526 RepID=A0AAE0K0D2_9PEZI|nr:hypothetical protein B0H63DRAFT_84654 [Podospora didyma]
METAHTPIAICPANSAFCCTRDESRGGRHARSCYSKHRIELLQRQPDINFSLRASLSNKYQIISPRMVCCLACCWLILSQDSFWFVANLALLYSPALQATEKRTQCRTSLRLNQASETFPFRANGGVCPLLHLKHVGLFRGGPGIRSHLTL